MHLASLPIGAARGQQLHLEDTPPRQEKIEFLRRNVRDLVNQECSQFSNQRMKIGFGSSGSIRALSRIYRGLTHKGRKLSVESLNGLIEQMKILPRDELARLPTIEPKRADIILSAAIVTAEVAGSFGISEIRPVTYALKDGLLLESIQRLI